MTDDLKIVPVMIADVLVLKLSGDLTAASSDALLEYFEKTKPSRSKTLLNFSNVEYINSAGIAILIQILSKTKRRNAKVICCCLIPHFQKIFQMLGLMKYTLHFDSQEEALGYFQASPRSFGI